MKFYKITYNVTAENMFTDEKVSFTVTYEGDYDPSNTNVNMVWDPISEIDWQILIDMEEKFNYDVVWDINIERMYCEL